MHLDAHGRENKKRNCVGYAIVIMRVDVRVLRAGDVPAVAAESPPRNPDPALTRVPYECAPARTNSKEQHREIREAATGQNIMIRIGCEIILSRLEPRISPSSASASCQY